MSIIPATGYVSPIAAVVIGIAAGVVCYFAVTLKNRLKWDDALDVWGVHGVGGALGMVLLGLFAAEAFNPAGTDGLFGGNPGFLGKQLVAIVLSSVWAFGFTYGVLWLIDRVTPVKVEQTDEERERQMPEDNNAELAAVAFGMQHGGYSMGDEMMELVG